MAKKQNQIITVKGLEVSIREIRSEDYISLTDMAKSRNNQTTDTVIQAWLKRGNTLRFIELWEQEHNPDFKPLQMQGIRLEVSEEANYISAKQLIERANIICIESRRGRYGGTYAHRDIAFEFATWLSPEFKYYLVKEFQRLKEEEYNREDMQWNYQRFLSKVNYSLHTDSIKRNIVPRLGKGDKPHAFSSEADLLNVAVFGMTAKEYREQFPDAKGNLREGASIRELTVLANMESMNSHLIEAGASQEARFAAIYKEAQRQLEVFAEDRRLGE